MLATLVIGLREGLEAALIVGIIAAFLRSNRMSLRPMFLGVTLAVALSIAVGVALDVVEQSLPQADQEAMESVIGVVAIFFVTTMIVWMNTHSRSMKRDLEAEAAEALSQGSAYALAVMAFLAVLKEGFETSVFLLATFSAAQSSTLAVLGAVIGILAAVAIGWGIYVGGVKINLSKFFRWTGAFLILVAAGLTVTALRTAHEAGWLNAGQQSTVDLSWLVKPGTVQSALITGVLGIPADPRVIEVIGWFAYLVPVALFVYWPASRRLHGWAAVRLQAVVAGLLALAAIVLAVAIPQPRVQVPATASLTAVSPASGVSPAAIGSARLTPAPGGATLRVVVNGSPATVIRLPAGQAKPGQVDGVTADAWTVNGGASAASLPSTLTLDKLMGLSGGRVPVGLDAQQDPGPFHAVWTFQRTTSVQAVNGVLLSAAQQTSAVVTVSGGGLQTSRTLSVAAPAAVGLSADWQVSAAYQQQAAAAVSRAAAGRTERSLWAVDIPIAAAIAALLTGLAIARNVSRLRRAPEPSPAVTPASQPVPAPTDVRK
jgi:high-affinity iron transporter